MNKPNVGDWALTPDGYIAQIVEIRQTWRNRADQEVKVCMCRVESPLSGTPILWWRASQLKRIKTPRVE